MQISSPSHHFKLKIFLSYIIIIFFTRFQIFDLPGELSENFLYANLVLTIPNRTKHELSNLVQPFGCFARTDLSDFYSIDYVDIHYAIIAICRNIISFLHNKNNHDLCVYIKTSKFVTLLRPKTLNSTSGNSVSMPFKSRAIESILETTYH